MSFQMSILVKGNPGYFEESCMREVKGTVKAGEHILTGVTAKNLS